MLNWTKLLFFTLQPQTVSTEKKGLNLDWADEQIQSVNRSIKLSSRLVRLFISNLERDQSDVEDYYLGSRRRWVCSRGRCAFLCSKRRNVWHWIHCWEDRLYVGQRQSDESIYGYLENRWQSSVSSKSIGVPIYILPDWKVDNDFHFLECDDWNSTCPSATYWYPSTIELSLKRAMKISATFSKC